MILASWILLPITLLCYLVGLYDTDPAFEAQVWKAINVIFDDPVARAGFIVGVVGYFIPWGSIYGPGYIKSISTIAEKSLITNISKHELAALLFTRSDLKILSSSDQLITLIWRASYHDHKVAIFDCGGIIKIVTNQFMFKIIEPLLKQQGIEFETEK